MSDIHQRMVEREGRDIERTQRIAGENARRVQTGELLRESILNHMLASLEQIFL